MKKRYLIIIIMFLIICIIIDFIYKKGKDINKIKDNPEIPQVEYTNNFSIDLIKTTRRDKNYLISPYSIEIALDMLKVGANNNTKSEIEKVVPKRNISDVSIKNRVNVANALFLKKDYKNVVKKNFTNNLTNNYNSEILYDKFKKPTVVNKWVKKQTDGMIEKIIDDIPDDFVLGIANAVAIDVEWASPFECNKTTSEEFIKNDNKKINVEMMHDNSKYYKYLKSEDATGVIIPYKPYNSEGEIDYKLNSKLEFVGILPNEDVDKYINNLTNEKLTDLLNNAIPASENFEIDVSLPRFKYRYEVPNFNEVLNSMGIKDAFDSDNADFTNIMNKENMKNNLYVNKAVHKTYIDLNENGTKAAAVTYIETKDISAVEPDDKQKVSIKFNKPFIYMIRDNETQEILFFGAVYEPNEWNGSTCNNK